MRRNSRADTRDEPTTDITTVSFATASIDQKFDCAAQYHPGSGCRGISWNTTPSSTPSGTTRSSPAVGALGGSTRAKNPCMMSGPRKTTSSSRIQTKSGPTSVSRPLGGPLGLISWWRNCPVAPSSSTAATSECP
eukprot:Amastigsp_a677336_7.p2 type:complete len:135 gc:universal Amastigsp_a677336_7:1031-627(-)